MKIRDGIIIKKGWCFAIMLLFIGVGVVGNTGANDIKINNYELISTYQPEDVIVNNDYNESTPNFGNLTFSSIQEGINAVAVGGNVYVCNGTYEKNVVITKSINLIGANEDDEWGIDTDSIISGSAASIIIIGGGASNTEITNFKLINSEVAGIFIFGSRNVKIVNNIIISNSRGIHIIKGDYSEVNQNNVSESMLQGIKMEKSKECLISLNHVKNSPHGIELSYCTDVELINNNITNISHYDIWIEHNPKIGDENDIDQNNFINTRYELGKLNYRWSNSKNRWDENYWSDRPRWMIFYPVMGCMQLEDSIFGFYWPRVLPQIDSDPSDDAYIIPEISLLSIPLPFRG